MYVQAPAIACLIAGQLPVVFPVLNRYVQIPRSFNGIGAERGVRAGFPARKDSQALQLSYSFFGRFFRYRVFRYRSCPFIGPSDFCNGYNTAFPFIDFLPLKGHWEFSFFQTGEGFEQVSISGKPLEPPEILVGVFFQRPGDIYKRRALSQFIDINGLECLFKVAESDVEDTSLVHKGQQMKVTFFLPPLNQ